MPLRLRLPATVEPEAGVPLTEVLLPVAVGAIVVKERRGLGLRVGRAGECEVSMAINLAAIDDGGNEGQASGSIQLPVEGVE